MRRDSLYKIQKEYTTYLNKFGEDIPKLKDKLVRSPTLIESVMLFKVYERIENYKKSIALLEKENKVLKSKLEGRNRFIKKLQGITE